MDAFDHFAKETLHARSYVRYTDDFVILHDNPIELVSLLPAIRRFLHECLFLALHPNKVTLRKVWQGIDFLGYVILPHHRVLRTKTRRRMFTRLNAGNLSSYEGLLRHADTHALSQSLRSRIHRLDATR